MDGVKNFFSQIDGRIFEINFSNFTSGGTDNSNYLFNPRPETFYMQSWAFVIGFLGIVFTILFLLFLKKRRNLLYIEKGKRHILSFHTKINLVFLGLYFLLVFFRSQGMTYLSMRFLAWMSLGLALLNCLAGIIRTIIHKPENEMEVKIKTDDTYHKYLPKKKK